MAGFETSWANLGLEYVNIYLMHWPMAYDESGTPRLQRSRE